MSKYLVVVDMQKDFIDGSLGSAEAQAVLPKVIEKIKNFPGTVVYTRDTHEDNYLETLEGKKLPVVHCVRDTEGWKFQEDIQELVTANRSLVFDKETFGSIQMAGCLQGIDRMAPIDEVIVVGTLYGYLRYGQCSVDSDGDAEHAGPGGCILLCRFYAGSPSLCTGSYEIPSD